MKKEEFVNPGHHRCPRAVRVSGVLRWLWLGMVAATLSSGMVWAQEATTGSIRGVVVDRSGEPVEQGEVLLVDRHRRRSLGSDGTFSFENVPPGDYVLEAETPFSGSGVLRLTVVAEESVEVRFEVSPAVVGDEIFVTGAAVARSRLDVAQPTTLLSGDELDRRRQSSLGETLAAEPGINATSFGSGASRPVIRGLGGDRVRMLEDGVGSADASNLSPDHAVSTDPLTAERIEVLRGPATLLYGSSAVGGVVNVIDGRVPRYVPEAPVSGSAEIVGGTVADEKAGAVSLNGGGGAFAWHADYQRREADDYEVPGRPSLEDDGDEPFDGVLENSAVETESGAFGASWVGDNGYFGVAVSGFDTLYGIPGGHGHGHEEEHEEGEEEHDEEEHEEEEEEIIRIDLEQRRVDLRGEVRHDFGPFQGVKVRFGVADYEHQELEGEEIGTSFENDSLEARFELVQRQRAAQNGSWNGSLGLQVTDSDFSAVGEEAFVPPSTTQSLALFAFEELERGEITWQGGLRFETQDVETALQDRSFDGVSASAGLIWRPMDDYSIAASLARTTRLPTSTELFADGPHLATGAFEVGDPNLEEEISTGLDVSFRKTEGRLTGSVNLFLNRFDDFIFESFTGEEEDELPVVRFLQRDAEFTGAEIDGRLHLGELGGGHLDLLFGSDLVRAELRGSGENLPRIPPLRLRAGLDYHRGPVRAVVEVRDVAEQDRTAPEETSTDGYTTVDASVGYRFIVGPTVVDALLRGRNLTDEERRNHVSFLKDDVLLPGRDVSLVLRVAF